MDRGFRQRRKESRNGEETKKNRREEEGGMEKGERKQEGGGGNERGFLILFHTLYMSFSLIILSRGVVEMVMWVSIAL